MIPSPAPSIQLPRRITAALAAHGLLRLAGWASGALVGFYLAALAAAGRPVDAGLVGALGFVANMSELAGAFPLGWLVDRTSPRHVLVWGSVVGALATQLFGWTGVATVFFVSRALEGVSAAAVGPAILTHLTHVTQGHARRGAIMGYFELSLLVGVALGGVVGGVLWDVVQTQAFSWIAALYLLVGVLFYWATQSEVKATPAVTRLSPWEALRRTLHDPQLMRLAPAWLAANAVVGLWLTHVFFLLNENAPPQPGQYLVGRFSASQVGALSLVYTLVFGVGVAVWGWLLQRLSRLQVMWLAWGGLLGVVVAFFLLNASQGWAAWQRGVVVGVYALAIMTQSGFTPAALTYLADNVGQQSANRGAALGLYTLLLGLGNALGAAWGGPLAQAAAFNGLLLGTLGLALVMALGLWRLSVYRPAAM